MPLRSFPPGPPGRWLSGNLPDFRQGRLDFILRCVREYGDVVGLRLGHRRVILLGHPDLIEQILVHRPGRYRKHFALRLNPPVLGNGLLTSEGDFWLKQRRMVQPAFQKGRMAGYAQTMAESAERLSDAWREGERRDLQVEMMKLTLDIAARTLFGADVGRDADDVVEAMQVLQEHFVRRFNSLIPLPLWAPTPGNIRFRRALRRLDAILFGFIRSRREKADERGDLLSLLLTAQDEDDGSRMSDRQVRDEAMTLFLAGHETTALALSWTWHVLSKRPDLDALLAAEWREVLGGRPPTFDDLPRLRLTEQVLLESMRLYPPAYVVGREALAEDEIGGYRIPRGCTVLMSQWSVQRDPRFFEDPESFRPERWEPEAAKRLHRFAYFPFGGGPRICVGNAFAMAEMTLTLATLGQVWRIEPDPTVEVQATPTFTLRPSPGIPVFLRRREA